MSKLLLLLASLVASTFAQECTPLYDTSANRGTISYTGVTDLTTPVTSIAIYTDGTYIYRFQINSGSIIPNYNVTHLGVNLGCADGTLITSTPTNPNPLNLGTGDFITKIITYINPTSSTLIGKVDIQVTKSSGNILTYNYATGTVPSSWILNSFSIPAG